MKNSISYLPQRKVNNVLCQLDINTKGEVKIVEDNPFHEKPWRTLFESLNYVCVCARAHTLLASHKVCFSRLMLEKSDSCGRLP